MTDISSESGADGRSPAEAFAAREGLDFIRGIVADDLRAGKYETIVTRFPPEPSGPCR